MITLPPVTTAGVVPIAPGVQWEWLFQGQAFAVQLASPSQKAIDVYAAVNRLMIHQWKNILPMYSIQYITNPDVALTPYFRKALDEINALTEQRHLTKHTMIVLQNNIAGHALRLFSINAARQSACIHHYYFSDYRRALTGLEELMSQAALV